MLPSETKSLRWSYPQSVLWFDLCRFLKGNRVSLGFNRLTSIVFSVWYFKLLYCCRAEFEWTTEKHSMRYNQRLRLSGFYSGRPDVWRSIKMSVKYVFWWHNEWTFPSFITAKMSSTRWLQQDKEIRFWKHVKHVWGRKKTSGPKHLKVISKRIEIFIITKMIPCQK